MSEPNKTQNQNGTMPSSHPAIEIDGRIEDYLSGSLTAEERETFEEDFLENPLLLDELETARRLREAGRYLAAETLRQSVLPFVQPPARRQRVWQIVAAAAAALCLAIFGFSWNTTRQLEQRLAANNAALASALAPRADVPLLALSLLRGESPAARLKLSSLDQQVVLLAAAPGDASGEHQLTLARGRQQLWQKTGALPDHRGEILVTLPASWLERGDYTLDIAGASGSAQHRFTVER